jgi:N-acetylmuramoyl-L-alanine amidase
VVVALLVLTALAAPTASDILPIGREMRVRLDGGRDLVLEIKPWPGEDIKSLARRIASSPVRDRLSAVLEDSRAMTPDGFHRVSFELLGPELRALVLRTVFPDDRANAGDWLHVARSSPLPIYDEGLWQVAAWFTGDGANFTEILRANGLSSPELVKGQVVRIPAAILDAALRTKEMSDDGTLAYGGDARGPYAGYRLKPGEALYSAVVLRYTGRTAPDDVAALAKTIAERSGVRSVTDIPAGWLVKIPLDVLEPEFLPRSDARRKSVEKAKDAMERELTARPPVKAKQGLAGVVVILDPGHGGMDPGTMNHAVWEHDYVFDVAMRLRRELETRTGAKVLLTLDDPSESPRPPRRTRCSSTVRARSSRPRRFSPTKTERRRSRSTCAGTSRTRAIAPWSRAAPIPIRSSSCRCTRMPGTRPSEAPWCTCRERTTRAARWVTRPRPIFVSRKSASNTRQLFVARAPALGAVSRKLASAIVKAMKKENLPVQATNRSGSA